MDAITKIMENAIRYSPENETVLVDVQQHEHTIDVIIQDHGPGMSSDIQEQALRPLYRGDEARTRRGFGLGLPVAQRIISLHNGDIRFVSKPGEGTTVILTLLLSQSPVTT